MAHANFSNVDLLIASKTRVTSRRYTDSGSKCISNTDIAAGAYLHHCPDLTVKLFAMPERRPRDSWSQCRSLDGQARKLLVMFTSSKHNR